MRADGVHPLEDEATLRTAARCAAEELETLNDFVRWGASWLGAGHAFFGHGTDNAVDEALALVLHALDLEPGLPEALFAGRLCREERRRIADLLLERRLTRKPSAYLTGRTWFAGLELTVDERALVPRSPIAELVERGLEPHHDTRSLERVVDVCTGGGCIAVACAMHWPWVTVEATDISAEALELAAENVARYGLEHRVRLHRTDLLDDIAPGMDLIICNPPYVPDARRGALPVEYHYEPALGLYSGSDGLRHARRLLVDAAKKLAPGGILVLEVGEAAASFLEAFPRLELTWLEFEHGGEGVMLVRKEALEAHRPALSRGARDEASP